jgi:flagellar hook-basal body complex protein FliE
MSLDAIATVAATALQGIADPAATSAAGFAVTDAAAAQSVSFDTLVNGVEALNERLVTSNDAVHALALGQVDNLHQVMMAGEQTRLAFDLLLQVRSKLLDAYQELLRMQV